MKMTLQMMKLVSLLKINIYILTLNISVIYVALCPYFTYLRLIDYPYTFHGQIISSDLFLKLKIVLLSR